MSTVDDGHVAAEGGDGAVLETALLLPVVAECRIGCVPSGLWKRLALFLAWRDAASLYTAPSHTRERMAGKWSNRWEAATERAALICSSSNGRGWRLPGWGSADLVSVWECVVTEELGLVRELDLRSKRLGGTND